MERKITFFPGEIYHVYNRGVNKQAVFLSDDDRKRFQRHLFLGNTSLSARMSNTLAAHKSKSDAEFYLLANRSGERVVDVLAYCLMDNHVHFIIRETREAGISSFMQKVMTGHAMYFNKTHERVGPLFMKPFRARHVDSDEYLRWLFAYVHLNPLDAMMPGWKEGGISDQDKLQQSLQSYPWSSYVDHFLGKRPETTIISCDAVADLMGDVKGIDDLLKIAATGSTELIEGNPR